MLTTSPALPPLTFAGTLDGMATGTQISLTYTAPAGSVPGFPACSAFGSGSAAIGQDTMTGHLDVTFVSCDDAGLQTPANDSLTLTKQ